MTKTIIPAGYRMTIESWENDADNYKTEIIEGLSKEETQFRLDILRLFGSLGGFGNMYDPNETETKKVKAAILKTVTAHRGLVSDDLLDAFIEEPRDMVGGMLGYSENYDYRVFDFVKIEYVEAPIELLDVTTQFK